MNGYDIKGSEDVIMKALYHIKEWFIGLLQMYVVDQMKKFIPEIMDA